MDNKQIEEMAKKIMNTLSHCCMCDDCNYKDIPLLDECRSNRVAEELIKYYQPNDEIWNSYYDGENNAKVYYENIKIPQVRKETAKEIINKLEQLQRCLKQVALNELIISLIKQYDLKEKGDGQ